MKSYPNLKETGIDWLGKLPAHWNIRRVKSVISNTVNGAWGEEPKGDENDLVCVRVADFDYDKLGISRKNLTTRNIEPSLQTTRLLDENDLLIEKSGGGDIWSVGRVVSNDLREKSVSSNFIARLVPSREIDSRFLCYVFAAMYAVRLNDRSIKQTTGIQNLDLYSYLIEKFGFPPLAEQRTIAKFLDNETAHIDSLIAKKRELIDLLDKKRTSIISHAVTKGLNPKARMKSSGVEWLGDVPEHWDVRRLKHLLRRGFTNGLFKKKEDFGNGTRLVNVSDIYQADFLIKINTLERVTATEQEVKVFSVQSGDIFFVRSSLKQEGVAASACMLEVPEPTVFESHVVRARPNSSLVIPKYLIYYLNSSLARQRLISLSETTTMTTVAQPKLSSLEVAFPSLAEQHDIVNLIDKRIFDIDELKKQITQSIDLLQKQRTALISAAVTGKIDVREQGN